MISTAEARELAQNLNDVFTPNGDAGVISRLYTFATPGHPLTGRGQCAKVVGENVNAWFPLSELDSAASIRERRYAYAMEVRRMCADRSPLSSAHRGYSEA